MSDNNRNKLCPCWSWKKLKKCYGNPDQYNNNCKLFLEEKAKEYVPYIQRYLDDVINEIIPSIPKLDEIRAIRSQFSLLIILVDLLSKIWYWFNERKKASNWNTKRLKDWFNLFIYTNNNKYRRKNEKIHNFTCDDFSNLRNSLLHKFALPDIDNKTWKSIILNNNSNHNLSKKFWKKHVFISPIDLMNLIWEWYALMIWEIWKCAGTQDYLKWINYIWLELHKEWAVLIRIDDRDKKVGNSNFNQN